MTKNKIYRIWQSMKDRCYNTKNKQYGRYGGRGIGVSDSWLKSFENFRDDMYKTYQKGLTLDRFPDNNGNYCKENCRWATQTQQCNNKNNNNIIEYRGNKCTLTELCREKGLNYNITYYRITKLGRTIDKIIEEKLFII